MRPTCDDDACEACGLSSVEFARMREDLANAERELRGYRSKVARLRGQQDAQFTGEELDQAQVVLRHWKDVLAPGARELGGERQRLVLARLRGGHTVADLCRCADGYALKPYVVNGRRTHQGPKDSFKADAKFIYADAERVDQGIRIVEQADELRKAVSSSGLRAQVPSEPSARGVALSALGEAARRMVSVLAVFPCKAGAKAPNTAHGLQDATRDVSRVTRWWQAHPADNVGIPTGMTNGFVVLDVDVDDGVEHDGIWHLHRLEDRHGELPDTKSVRTPRGGLHLYWQHPGPEVRNTTGYPAPGLDIRGDGGYVLAPPSIVNGTAYEVDDDSPLAPMPAWLLKLLLEQQLRMTKWANEEWVKFLRDGAAQGARDNRMTQYVGHLVAHGITGFELEATVKAVNAQVFKPPMDDRQLQKIVQSIVSRHNRAQLRLVA